MKPLIGLFAFVLAAGLLFYSRTVEMPASGLPPTSLPSSVEANAAADAPPPSLADAPPPQPLLANVALRAPSAMPPPVTIRGAHVDMSGFAGYDGWRQQARRALAASELLGEPRRLHGFKQAAMRGDGEAAFIVYAYLHACAQAPVTRQQAEVWTQDHAQWLARHPDQNPEEDYFRANAARLMDICAGYDRAALGTEMYQWLRLSADLGFAAAYEIWLWEGRQLAISFALRGGSGWIAEYRGLTQQYLERWLASGHPQAFFNVSELYRQGKMGPRDLVYAVAYARALEHASIPGAAELAEWVAGRGLELRLDDDQLHKAQRLAAELCERYVPRECRS